MITVLLRCARLPFLLLTLSCCWLGIALVIDDNTPFDSSLLLPILLGAISAHLSVNLFNEYRDFRSGLDQTTIRTPFSGGSGALPAAPDSADAVLMAALATAGLTIVAGVYLLGQTGPAILPIGVLGLLLVFLYTDILNRHPVACLIAPGLGIWLIVTGTVVALTGTYDLSSMLIALVPFLLTNNLLLLNQYPDIEADKRVGRRHLPIAFGAGTASHVYLANAILAYLTVLLLVFTGILPGRSLLVFLTLPMALVAWSGARKYQKDLGQYPIYLAMNVLVALLTPAVLGLSLEW